MTDAIPDSVVEAMAEKIGVDPWRVKAALRAAEAMGYKLTSGDPTKEQRRLLSDWGLDTDVWRDIWDAAPSAGGKP